MTDNSRIHLLTNRGVPAIGPADISSGNSSAVMLLPVKMKEPVRSSHFEIPDRKFSKTWKRHKYGPVSECDGDINMWMVL